MRDPKGLGLVVVATLAMAAIVGASTASATTLTGEGGAVLKVGTAIHAASEGVTTLTTSFKNLECSESTIAGNTTNEGGTAITISIESWTFAKCNCEEKVLKGGTLSISSISNTDNGTLSSNGLEVTSTCSTIFGNVHCIYVTENTTLGTLTGSATTGATPTIDVEGANIPRLTTSSLCAERAAWDVKYKIDNPDELNVTS